MNHKEMTDHIRTCIKRYGIKAGVKMQNICGDKVISISTSSYDSNFTSEEIYNICMAAKSNNLTLVKGLKIIPEEQSLLIHKKQWDFRFNSRGLTK